MTPPVAATAANSDNLIVLTDAEWRRAAEARLHELNLSYAELMRQARNQNFASTAARKLWVLIGGTL
jgi:hypothetical protein